MKDKKKDTLTLQFSMNNLLVTLGKQYCFFFMYEKGNNLIFVVRYIFKV